jgi:hypothetical protein
MPDARILFLMPNPIESNYSGAVTHLRHVSTQRQSTTAEALWTLGNGKPSHRANDLRILEKWQRFYPAEQIFVHFIEDRG